MQLTPSLDPNVATGEEFVLETDQAPEFWQFLNGLRGDDLLVELIVNELDARSPRTEIRFEADRLVCVGEGEPVDADGWERLRKLKGAGHQVKAKVALFGIKNHGLKACFTLGNDILVRSAGKQILQTLFADGPERPAYPGVRIPPRDDPGAPSSGAQIEVPYRREAFVAPHGEAIAFPPIGDDRVDAIFRDAVETLPQRLLGILRPGVLDAYTLVLAHHSLGSLTLSFRSTRPRREGNTVVFTRECVRCAEAGEEQVVAREQAVLFVWAPSGFEQRPRFFQASTYRLRGKAMFGEAGLVIEAAWNIDGSGRLRPTSGRLRYPVSYPGETAETGLAMHYSGPFVSDTERHELGAQSKTWNDALIAACDDLAATALIGVVLPRQGAPGLQLVSGLGDQTRLTAIVERLLASRALPTVDPSGKPVKWSKKSRLLIPTYESATSLWASALARVCPPGSVLVDPKTPAPITGVLAGATCKGWKTDHLRFDDGDVLERMSGPAAEWFPWASDAQWRKILGQAESARYYLDALLPVLAEADVKTRASAQDVYLPDGDGVLHAFPALKRGVSLPSGVMGVDLPPVIHPALRDHPVFRLDGWKLENYAFRDMLAEGNLAVRPIAIRRRFFDWMMKHPEEIARDNWPALKALPIWPATDGTLQLFDSLCQPDAMLAGLLAEHLRRPRREVKRLCETVGNTRVHLRLRKDPYPEEIAAFYRAQIAVFPADSSLTQAEQNAFGRFESGLAALCRSTRAAHVLRSIAEEALALDRTGFLRPALELVRETPEIARLRLLDDALIARAELDLDRVFPPAAKPTAAMALEALRHDATRTEALLPRLRVATGVTDLAVLAALRTIPCIPVDERLLPAESLAFRGNAGDFWGEWKRVISATGLSDDAQDLYRAAGVIKSLPDAETSRAFFIWLNHQPAGAAGRHLDQVIRHLAHKQGVAAWRLLPPETACVPVETASGISLLTLSEARRTALLDDFPALADEIRAAQPPFDRFLAIHSVKACATPVADQLREWGVPSLSSVAKGPLTAFGERTSPAPSGFLEASRGLASKAAARRFRKQLQELDVSQALVEPQFQRRLAAVKAVNVATGLRAQFRIGRRTFHPQRDWAVLPEEIWLNAEGDLDDLLMKALADLIFVYPRPRYMPAILKAALSTGARDYRVREDDDDFDDVRDEDGDDDDVDEATHRHPGADPDPSRNKPRPSPLYTGPGSRKRPPTGPPSSGTGRTDVTAETVQRRQLKAEHYAFHCQIELAKHAPETLAPAGSYAEFAENRRSIMEAHHPDKVSASGSRHAGNLLILSHLNHEKIGTTLSRQQITEALQSAWTPRTIYNADGAVWSDGGVAAAMAPVSGEVTEIYFTHEHRQYWLEMAGVAPSAVQVEAA